MKANELMLGDFVQFDEDVCIVEEVRVDGTVVLVSLNTDLTSIDGDQVYIDEISPIELTAEILEKNFEVTDDVVYGKHYGYYTDYMEVDIYEYTESIWQIRLDEIEMSGLPTWKMYVSDVHELQHALRLCGINKEITI